jgi:hypothetical protein
MFVWFGVGFRVPARPRGFPDPHASFRRGHARIGRDDGQPGAVDRYEYVEI